MVSRFGLSIGLCLVLSLSPAWTQPALADAAEDLAAALWGRGCLLGSFCVDLAEVSPEVRRRVAALFDRTRRTFADAFEPLAASMAPGAPSAEQLAAHFVALLEGAIVVARAHDDTSHILKVVRSFRLFLKLLLEGRS